MEPDDAVEVWEEICQPIFIATRKIPEVAYILQMRAVRLDLDLFDFKEEVPKILHTITFLYSLKDEQLTKGKIKSSLLQYYKRAVAEAPPDEHTYAFVERFLTAICSAMLVAKVLPGSNISLSGVLKPVIEKRGNIEQIVGLGLKSLGTSSFADAVKSCLNGEDANEGNRESSDDDDQDSMAAAEDDDNDDEDDEDDEDDDRFDEFLTRFKNALQKIYEAEADVGDEEAPAESVSALLDRRLKAVGLFRPMGANIPSLEEAQAIAKRIEAAKNAGKPRKISSGRSSGGPAASSLGGSGGGGGGGAGGAGGGGASGGGTAAAAGDTAGMSSKERASAIIKSQSGGPKSGNRSGFIETGDVDSGVDVSAADIVESSETSLPELGARAQEIARMLSSVESSDQEIWSVFLEPSTDFKNLRGAARTITTSTTGSNKAYSVIKRIAQYHSAGQLLHGQDQRVVKNRNFTIEVTGFINTLGNGNKSFEAGDRALGPLKKILDHAAVTLVRLEALKTNFSFSEEHPDEYSAEGVTKYYEEALRSITDQVNDGDLLGAARQKADTDTRILYDQFEAEKFVEDVMRTCRSYLSGLHSEGHTKSLSGLNEGFAGDPLKFEDLDPPSPAPGQIPGEILMPTGYGDIFDTAFKYLASQVWELLSPVHKPEDVMEKLKTMMREVLVGSLEFEGENRRHQEKPSFALSVVSLEKVAENPNLREFYVRVDDKGQLATVEGYEDGSFVDLFEMREYKPSRVHAAAKKKASAEGTEELQTGRKYLFTVGRTNKLFCGSPSELINGCVRSDEGGPMVFPVFK